MQVGDIIKCHDAEDMVDTMMCLAKAGVDTDFDYSVIGEHRLVVLKVEEADNGRCNG